MDAVCLMGATKLYSEWAPGSFKICLSILCYCTGISYSSDFTWNLSRPISFLGFRALVLVAQQRLTMMVWMTRAFFIRMIKTHYGKLRNISIFRISLCYTIFLAQFANKTANSNLQTINKSCWGIIAAALVFSLISSLITFILIIFQCSVVKVSLDYHVCILYQWNDGILEQFVGSRKLVLIVHIRIFSLSFHLWTNSFSFRGFFT